MRVEDVVDQESLKAYLDSQYAQETAELDGDAIRKLEVSNCEDIAWKVAYRSCVKVLPLFANFYAKHPNVGLNSEEAMAVFRALTATYQWSRQRSPMLAAPASVAASFAPKDQIEGWSEAATVAHAISQYARSFDQFGSHDKVLALCAESIASASQAMDYALGSKAQGQFWGEIRNELTIVNLFELGNKILVEEAVYEKWTLAKSTFFIRASENWAELIGPFDKLLAVYRSEDEAEKTSQEFTLSKGKPEDIAQTKGAMIQYRRELPPTLDAILGYISLEIERLQGKNDNRDEVERQITVLLTIYKAVQQLTILVPENDEMAEDDAKKAEGLVRLYVNKFKEWPRANVDEIVDNTYRFALIGLVATAAPMVGVSATVAAGAGAVFFGGKKILDGAKVAKDLVGGTS